MQSESHPGEEEKIDRAKSWVLARKDKEGNFKNDKIREKAEEIVSYLISKYFIFLSTL